MFKKVNNKKGFTLIELIVVIAILAVLAAIIIPTVASSLESANRARDLANARSAYATLSIGVLTGSITANGTVPAAGSTCTYTIINAGVATFSYVMPSGTYTLQATGVITGPVTP